MNLKEALKEAGEFRGVKRKDQTLWMYASYYYLHYKNNDGLIDNANPLLIPDAIAEDWIVEPLPEPRYSFNVVETNNWTPLLFATGTTKSEILAAVKKWACDDPAPTENSKGPSIWDEEAISKYTGVPLTKFTGTAQFTGDLRVTSTSDGRPSTKGAVK